MKSTIYIPAKSTINPFICELVQAINRHQNVYKVYDGIEKFLNKEDDFDVVIFQWPEVLFNWALPEKRDLDFLECAISRWKQKGVQIFATVHNDQPHAASNENTSQLYYLIYSNCDKIIHLGESSKKILQQSISYNIDKWNEVVIKHGNYKCFPNLSTKKSARAYLKIKQDKWVLLCFGHIRNKKERNLILDVAKYIRKYNGMILIAGKILGMPNNKKKLNYYYHRRSFFLSRNIKLHEGLVEDNRVHFYLNASDGLFIPRTGSLNSGNVALGFTFGKIVIGENYGVIGEELRARQNPVFSSLQDNEVHKAIDVAYKLRDSKVPKSNKAYAVNQLDWDKIADQYVNLILNQD